MLTNKNLVEERPHSLGEGVQRIYRIDNWGLSLVNPKRLHSYPFAWEAAVIRFHYESCDTFDLIYYTPLTSDVEVFDTDAEANEFIERAFAYFEEQNK